MSLNYTVETKIKAAERYLRGEGNSCCLDNRITGKGEQKSTQRGRKPEKGALKERRAWGTIGFIRRRPWRLQLLDHPDDFSGKQDSGKGPSQGAQGDIGKGQEEHGAVADQIDDPDIASQDAAERHGQRVVPGGSPAGAHGEPGSYADEKGAQKAAQSGRADDGRPERGKGLEQRIKKRVQETAEGRHKEKAFSKPAEAGEKAGPVQEQTAQGGTDVQKMINEQCEPERAALCNAGIGMDIADPDSLNGSPDGKHQHIIQVMLVRMIRKKRQNSIPPGAIVGAGSGDVKENRRKK